VFIANKNNACPIKGLSGVYLSAFNKRTLITPHFQKESIIGSAHSFKEIIEKIKSKCNIILLSPIFEKSKNKSNKPIGIIKFLLISQHFKNISLYPLGGIYNPLRIKAYGIKGFAGVRLFNKKII
jgi:thiamine monophosphate synthase